MPSEVFEFELNGRPTEVMAKPLATLGHVLREQLELHAAKAGCRQGGCGSLHGAGRRRAGAVVPAPGGERRGAVGEDAWRGSAARTRCSRSSTSASPSSAGSARRGCSSPRGRCSTATPRRHARRSPRRWSATSAAARAISRSSTRSRRRRYEQALSQQPFHVVGPRRSRARDGMGHVTGRPSTSTTSATADAPSEDGPQPAGARADPRDRPLGGREGPGLRPRADRGGRAEQRLHDPVPDRRRAGRGAGARRRAGHATGASRSRRSSPRPRRPRCEAVSPRRSLDLEELPAVFDVEEALSPTRRSSRTGASNNFIYEGHHCRRLRFGDVAAGFAQARPRHRGHLPALADRARADGDHRLHRQARGRRPDHRPHQHPGALLHARQHRDHPADRPGNRLHFIGGTVGGGFGGKVDVITEPIATLAAMKTGRPVRYVYTREEEMRVSLDPRRRTGSGSSTA